MAVTPNDVGPLSAVYDFDDVIERRAVARFRTGEHPVAEDLEIGSVDDPSVLVPPGSEVLRARDRRAIFLLAEGPGWTVRFRRFDGGHTQVSVSAVDTEVLAKVVAEIRANAPAEDPDAADVELDFTFLGRGAQTRRRRVATPRWSEIRRNYGPAVRDGLDRLVTLRPDAEGARLLLWHGPAGTGKTTAVRALMRSWRGWCRSTFIMDPDRFLTEAGYLMEVVLRGHEDDDDDEETAADGGPNWRLLVIEDPDQFVRRDARQAAGIALGRLLNLSDGMIGQGLRVLVLISTNEPLSGLDPAIRRPGRCLSSLHFDRLGRDDARRWLGEEPPVGDGFSLAELYAIQRGESPGDGAADGHAGLYL